MASPDDRRRTPGSGGSGAPGRRPYGNRFSSDRSTSGGGKPRRFGDGGPRQGQARSGGDRYRQDGDRPRRWEDRDRPAGGDRRQGGARDRRERPGGESRQGARPSGGGDRGDRSYRGDRPSYQDRPRSGGGSSYRDRSSSPEGRRPFRDGRPTSSGGGSFQGSGERRSYGRPSGDRPRWSSDRPRTSSDRPYGDRRPSSEGRSYQDRSGSGRSYQGRSDRPYQGRDSRPDQNREGRPYQSREGRTYQRSEGRPAQDRSSSGRPYAGRSDGGRPYAGRSDSGRSYQDRPRRPYQDRDGGSYQGRPAQDRSAQDRPARSYQDRGASGRPAGGRSYGDNRTGGGSRSYGDNRSSGGNRSSSGDRAFSGNRSFGGNRDRDQDRPPRRNQATDHWGALARRGAATFDRDHGQGDLPVEERWRGAPPAGDWEPDEVWVREDEEEATSRPARKPAAATPVERDLAGKEGSAPGGHRRNVPQAVVSELTDADPTRGARLAARLGDATHAYERQRYQEARRILRPIAEEMPEVASVRELAGLIAYRMGDWRSAVRELEAFRTLSSSYDQHPVLADCYRALRRYADAETLWDELREASPDGDLVAEGRIVAAGCHADQGDLQGAIAILERSAKRVDHPKERHLRQWYTLADLYERAGDLPRARELFRRISSVDPDAFDVRARLRALR